jgi:hypothetical protein
MSEDEILQLSLPYLLDEKQQEATRIKQTAVIIGRGGTGKTSVLARKLYDTFSSQLRQDLVPPRQLFVSQSKLLVEVVSTYSRILLSIISSPLPHSLPFCLWDNLLT